MTRPSASEIIFISVNQNITLMGKVWLVVMVLLRLLMLLLAGYPLYQDEQERFVCNTIQPGCANVCYDHFSPISLFRFWLVQLITLCLPYVIFIIYVVHKVANGLTVDLSSSDPVKAVPLVKTHQEPINKSTNQTSLVAERGRARRFTAAYVLHLMFRTLLEAGFGAAHYYLFGFYIPKRFLCQHPPCTTQVDCYISRPTEKTVMLNFMLGAAALSLLLNVLDLVSAIRCSARQTSKKRTAAGERDGEGEEQCFLSGGEASKGTDLNPCVAQQDLEGEAAQSVGLRRKRGSGGGLLPGGPEPPCLEHSSPPHSSGPPGYNTNGNNGYYVSPEEPPERNGSDVALCPPEPVGTPRSIRVSKRNRLRPPPPPRRDVGLPRGGSTGPPGTVTAAATTVTRRVGQYTLVELGSGTELQTSDDGQEKRSEWV